MKGQYNHSRMLRNNWLIYGALSGINKRPFDGSRKFLFSNDFIIDGYPRTANTFLTHYFMETFDFPQNRIGHHFHAPAAVYYASFFNKKAVFTLREPYGSISSYVLHRYGHEYEKIDALGNIQLCILKYEDYLDAINNIKSSNVLVFNFSDIVSNPERIMEVIQKKYNLKTHSSKVGEEDKTAVVQEKIKKIETNTGNDKDVSLRVPNPNEQRNEHKKKVKEIIDENFKDSMNSVLGKYEIALRGSFRI
ncbi:hypothetical protein L861_02225 [Litchfieldella anticariensis FP35 = DSM 16096]|uniref:Sulfotransferase domain-containing protein n=1 Tax=Litchfieldella anticariensis (strain DSM 16096 / CECT 5854 / CIP 108499 / LMG 22089 / FP35) TaxID=1121939 RepID=S2KQJ0_LITA3|nr:hypothetical protein [Halomonas anticariensis]EPC04150.1 hypothetical protein L861_02225 [Halomonas anticariensis FP35 = DSM 16096]